MRSAPIGFFVHHQGRGHAKRCSSIIAALKPRPIRVFCADPSLFDLDLPHVEIEALPNAHAQPSRTEALHRVPACSALDCAPLGVDLLRRGLGRMAAWMADADPALMVVDVSAEVTMLTRLCSVPSVTIRMHGDRSDPAHMAAYTASVGMIAPFDPRLEQEDYPATLRRRTVYTGGLVDMRVPVPERDEARRRLGLDPEAEIVLAIAGGGGVGIPLAPVSMAARALPETQWLLVGKLSRDGHETEFANMHVVGWVDDPLDYIAAADAVVATCGDTLVHEITRVGRPLLCIPEWCYYDEQPHKAQVIAKLGACAHRPRWPASFGQWREAMDEARTIDLDVQRSLTAPDAARRAAAFLDQTIESLWADASSVPRLEVESVA